MKILIRRTYKLGINKNPPEEAKVAPSIKFFNVKKNQACYSHQDFEIQFCSNLFHTTSVCPSQGGRHSHTKGQRHIQTKNLDDCRKNFLFCLKVWLFGGLAETSLNKFEQKPSKTGAHVTNGA